MEDEGRKMRKEAGRFLMNGKHPADPGKIRRVLSVIVLLAWDGLLLHMMVECLIEPVYGAVFIGGVSFYLGYQL